MTRVGRAASNRQNGITEASKRLLKSCWSRERRLIYEERKKNEREIKIPPFWFRLNAKEISF